MAQNKSEETLCWSCDNACGKCPWSSNLTPIPDWQAKKTKIINKNEQSYESFVVYKCPMYKPTVDYYDSEAQLLQIIANRTGYTLYSVKAHRESALKAYLKYQKIFPRSLLVPEETRNAQLMVYLEKELKKEKIQKKLEKISKKSKKIEKKC